MLLKDSFSWIAALAATFAAVSASGSASIDELQTADELLAFTAQIPNSPPVDYGWGPGRGWPQDSGPARGQRRPDPLSAPPANWSGSVTGITLSSGGAYAFQPSCSIAGPDSGSGQRATCTVAGFGIQRIALNASTKGSGYKVGDTLTMMPMPGLTCLVYPSLGVATVDGNGAITKAGLPKPGICTSFPTNGTYSFSSESGSGYTTPTGPNGILWYAAYATVSGGSGYRTAPAVTFQTSPNITAKGTATITNYNTVQTNVPVGGPTANVQGMFGSAIPWPINGLHMALLPDGRILNYGTDEHGVQSGALLYDLWDPQYGTGANAHMSLPNTTATDLFCSGTSVLWTTGKVLITGGDVTVDRVRGFGSNKSTIFNPGDNSVAQGAQMQYPRWYGTVVPLPNGGKLVLGGKMTGPFTSAPDGTLVPMAVKWASTPEVFDPTTGWRALTGSNTPLTNWFYPQAFVTPAGDIIEIADQGTLFRRTTDGVGTVLPLGRLAPQGSPVMPTVMYAPGKLLSLRQGAVVTVDINGAKPVVTPTANIDQPRFDANATILPDGKVLVTGGSLVHNQLAGAAYATQIWNPATGTWTTGAAAAKPRLYHSNAILLPDGTVLTGAGGSPGPVINLNAEIYYPPYLYMNDGSGNPASRPVIANALAAGGIQVGSNLGLIMADANPISRVTLVRAGAATHATNVEQRFLDLTPTMVQNGQQITVTLPSNPNVVMPGYWLVFAFNQAGVPSVAQQILITN